MEHPFILTFKSVPLAKSGAKSNHMSLTTKFNSYASEAFHGRIASSNMTRLEIANHLDMSVETLRTKLRNPGKFTITEYNALCDLLSINPLIQLTHE